MAGPEDPVTDAAAVATGIVGAAVILYYSATKTECPQTNDQDPCDELTPKVRAAKDHMGDTYKKGEAVCKDGMSPFQLTQRYRDWLGLASARAQRDQKCFGGGDDNHQMEQATAWKQVGNCQNSLRGAR